MNNVTRMNATVTTDTCLILHWPKKSDATSSRQKKAAGLEIAASLEKQTGKMFPRAAWIIHPGADLYHTAEGLKYTIELEHLSGSTREFEQGEQLLHITARAINK